MQIFVSLGMSALNRQTPSRESAASKSLRLAFAVNAHQSDGSICPSLCGIQSLAWPAATKPLPPQPRPEQGSQAAIDRNTVGTWRSGAQHCIAIRRSQRIARRALRWSSEGEVSVEVKVGDIGRGLDIGSLQ
jgi:hypothetical protein